MTKGVHVQLRVVTRDADGLPLAIDPGPYDDLDHAIRFAKRWRKDCLSLPPCRNAAHVVVQANEGGGWADKSTWKVQASK